MNDNAILYSAVRPDNPHRKGYTYRAIRLAKYRLAVRDGIISQYRLVVRGRAASHCLLENPQADNHWSGKNTLKTRPPVAT
ncbi:hypothetical protein DPMN_183062 [Dreissena polymorpha]|uniref:Uncharacterized protein n=1 Tax=Dreissena polymorpha TaxID=45954 RepID=A0A9D4I3A0_DREPO|nr:hypothetical protein DPMN_183062 [Dreissena polymorpha]